MFDTEVSRPTQKTGIRADDVEAFERGSLQPSDACGRKLATALGVDGWRWEELLR